MKSNLIKILTLGLSIFLINGSLTGCNIFNHNNNNDGGDIVNPPNNDDDPNEGNKEDEVPDDLVDIPTPPEVPEGMEMNELSYVYASISIDLMAMGYQSFTAKAQSDKHCEYGIGYTDCVDGVKFSNSDKFYFSSGFLSFSANKTSAFKSNSQIFLTPIDNEKKEVVNDEYGFIVTFKETNIPSNHFIVNDKYIKYSVSDGIVNLSVLEKKSSNYDLKLGKIYDYTRNEYEFIPYDEISSEPLEYVPLVEAIDTKALKDNLHAVLDKQEETGYRLESITITYISLDSLNALRGLLSQDDSVNGFSLDYLDSLKLDSSKQYVHFNEDGSITLKDLPPDPKGLIDWLVDGLVYAGLAGIVIISGVVFGPLGASAVFAGIQYFTETAIQGKKFNDVDWDSFFVKAAAGTLKGLARYTMPGVGGILVEGLIGGLASSTISYLHGGSENDIIEQGFKGALISMLFATIARIVIPGGSVKEDTNPVEKIPYNPNVSTGGDELTKELIYTPNYVLAEAPTNTTVLETVSYVATRETAVQTLATRVADELEMVL